LSTLSFSFQPTPPPEASTLSLHDALPICSRNVALEIAGRFADKSRTFGYLRYRAGRNHGDFTDFVTENVEPQGKKHFAGPVFVRSEEHTSELQSPCNLVCRLLLEKKKKNR